MKASLLARVAPVMMLSATLAAGMAATSFAESTSASSSVQAPSPGTQAATSSTPATTPGTPGTTTQGTASADQSATGNAANGEAAPTMEQLAAQRIEQLHTRLNINQQEQPKWDRFAKVMRDNAHDLDQAYQQRAEKIDSMNAMQNMQSYSRIEQMRARDMEKLVSPFRTLYAALTPQQKQDADSMFRNQAEAAQQRHQAAAATAAQTGH